MCDIDFLIGTYGHAENLDTQIVAFLLGLRNSCNLSGVNIYCAERTCHPLTSSLKNTIQSLGYKILSCPQPPATNSREDTSLFTDWIIENSGTASWVIVSHFDIVFKGDYIAYVRSMMSHADMIGNHHDGIVAFSRDAYQKCRVGFCGIDEAYVIRNSPHMQILPRYSPGAVDGWPALALDVGELLALRMKTLGLKHVWLQRDEEWGKSHLFDHIRQGSGHGIQ